MNLISIKLAGFKSFVDPTTIDLHPAVSVIVGPNGCGKSNILDAIRWVIGESTAKRLRGDVISDFIFSGSDSRSPSSRASVELVFNNSDGRIGGEYAAYAELSVRREILTDSRSSYYLNGRQCRRKDVQGVFLGTGFGTRGYSIIQQDWITQLVNSDPETLREHLEEAAGVSKYRTDRKETLNKLNLTSQNLEQVRLKQNELAREIRQLKTQATKTKRYEQYSTELNTLKARLVIRRVQSKERDQDDVSAKLVDVEAKLTEINERSASYDGSLGELEARLSEQRRDREKSAESRIEGRTLVNAIENRIEQATNQRSAAATNIRLKCDQLNDSLQTLENDNEELAILATERSGVQERRSKFREEKVVADRDLSFALRNADEARDLFVKQAEHAEALRDRIATLNSKRQIDEAKVANLEHLIESVDVPDMNVGNVQASIDESRVNTAEAEQRKAELLEEQSRLEEKINAKRRFQTEFGEKLVRLGRKSQSLRDELLGIKTLHDASIGQTTVSIELERWLSETRLKPGTRVGEMLEVEEGWEDAVEVVLGTRIQAIAISDLTAHLATIDSLRESDVVLLGVDSAHVVPAPSSALTSLVSKLRVSQAELAPLFEGVYAVDSFSDAVTTVEHLGPNESVITKDGAWIAKSWVWLFRGEHREPGVIRSSRRIDALTEEVSVVDQGIDELKAQQADVAREIEEDNQTRELMQSAMNDVSTNIAENRTLFSQFTKQLDEKQVVIAEVQQNRTHRQADLDLLFDDIATTNTLIGKLSQERAVVQVEIDASAALKDRTERVLTSKEEVCEVLVRQLREAEVELSQLDVKLGYLQKSHIRQDVVVKRLVVDICTLIHDEKSAKEDLPNLERQRIRRCDELSRIETDLARKSAVLSETERELAAVRKSQNELLNEKDGFTASITKHKTHLNGLGIELSQLQHELSLLGGSTIDADFKADGKNELDAQVIEQHIDTLNERMRQLGLINYRATTDLNERTQEKDELDKQVDDLETAVSNLESVIERIDNETKRQLRATFDLVNTNLARVFRLLFGGGSASLEFTEGDILQAGIVVRAQPPGKRNSTINMLSGGERAMAAIAFVFALFELKPSPVCVLDEVDAPLDERNISKFTDLLTQMSDETQFVVITHNPATMELAGNLLGVTMEEPGVSRLVAVNLADAYAMAAN